MKIIIVGASGRIGREIDKHWLTNTKLSVLVRMEETSFVTTPTHRQSAQCLKQ